MPDEPTDDDPLAPFRWHPEPELIGVRDASTSRAALEQAGEATWTASLDWLYDQAMVRAMGLPTGYAELRRAYFGETAEPGRAPDEPATLQAVLDEFAARIAPAHAEQLPSSGPQLLHPAAADRLDRRRGARPVDEPGRRRLARGSRRRVRRGGGRALAVRPRGLRRGQLRAAGVGRRHGQLHRAGARPRRAPPGAHRRRATAARGRARGRPRLRQRPGPLLHRPGARRARLPARDPRPRPRRRRVPAPRRARRRSHRQRSRGGPSAGGHRRRRRVDQHGLGRPGPGARGARRDGGLWLHVDAAYGGAARLSARDADRVPGLHLADSVTIDPHKWFFQAYDVGALLVRDGRHLRQAFDRSPEYYRGGEAAVGTADRRATRPRRRRRRPRRPAELLQAGLRGDPPVPGAQAVGDLEAPRHQRPRPAHRAQRRHRRVPGRPLRRGRRPRGAPRAARAQRRVLPSPAGRVRRRERDGTRGPRRAPGPPRDGARAVGRRLAVDDLAPRPDLAPRRGSSTT